MNSRSFLINCSPLSSLPSTVDFIQAIHYVMQNRFSQAAVVSDGVDTRDERGKLWFVRTRCQRRNGYYPIAISEIIKLLRRLGRNKGRSRCFDGGADFAEGAKFLLQQGVWKKEYRPAT